MDVNTCPICTDEDNTKSPICDECWKEVQPLRNALAEIGYEVTKQEMVNTWTTQMALEKNLYDGDSDSAWRAAINIHVLHREEREQAGA